jgi:hypothetical protein
MPLGLSIRAALCRRRHCPRSSRSTNEEEILIEEIHWFNRSIRKGESDWRCVGWALDLWGPHASNPPAVERIARFSSSRWRGWRGDSRLGLLHLASPWILPYLLPLLEDNSAITREDRGCALWHSMDFCSGDDVSIACMTFLSFHLSSFYALHLKRSHFYSYKRRLSCIRCLSERGIT